MSTMRLFHYTSNLPSHIGSILAEGAIRTTESNLSARREHAGPDVVWLTSDANLTAASFADSGKFGYHGLVQDKAAVRITVELPARQVHRWRDWVAARGADPAWVRHLSSAGGSGRWYVIERRVLDTEFTQIIDTATGQPLAQIQEIS